MVAADSWPIFNTEANTGRYILIVRRLPPKVVKSFRRLISSMLGRTRTLFAGSL
jgi:hypothetical protein